MHFMQRTEHFSFTGKLKFCEVKMLLDNSTPQQMHVVLEMFPKQNPASRKKSALALARRTKSRSLDCRAGGVNCSNPKEWRWEKESYRLVDLQEICAQPMVCDIEELPLERIMIFKLSSHLVILMVTTIIFILGILHWATTLKVWLSLCEEWIIHLSLAVCNTGKTLLHACSYSSWQRICI